MIIRPNLPSIPQLALALAMALGLGACTTEPGAPAETDAPSNETTESVRDVLITAESGWLTIGGDGAVQTTFFDAGGRYRDLRNGALLAEGSWELREDASVCFEPDAGRGACWQIGAVDDNGTAIATDPDGKQIEIRRVTYVAPPPAEDGGDGSN